MNVECIRIIDSETGEIIEKSSWLSVGGVYQVLSIFISDCGPTEYRLIADDGNTPAIYEASQFKIINDTLPLNWVVTYEDKSYFELAPKSWSEAGFWEDYFDGEPLAIEKFETEVRIINGNAIV